MRLVALAPDGSAGAAYRAMLPMAALAERGHRTEFLTWDMRDAGPPVESLRDADVVHMWRLYRAPARRLASALREAGVAVVFDNDDDMTRVPKGSPAYTEMKAARAQVTRELSATLRLADMVTTTCGELAGRLRRLGGGDVRVVENYVDPGFVRDRQTTRDGVVIGWVAGGEHRGDLKELRLRRVLQQLLDAHPTTRLVTVGLDVGVQSDRYTHHPFIEFGQLPSVISQFDVAIAPIADVSFNRVRSNIKVKEYAASGVPWLASPIGPYRELGEEQGGRLVADHEWAAQLEALVADAPARARLAERAAAWGRTQTVDRNAQEWETVFAEVAGRVGRTVTGVRAAEPVTASAPVVPAPVVPRAEPLAEPSEPGRAADPEPAGAPARRRGFLRRRGRGADG